MGVMSCSRSDCTNIMCDTYIGEIGYICNECQNEFKEHCSTKDLSNEYEIKEELKNFVWNNSKAEQKELKNKISIDEFFNQYTNK